MPPVTEAVTEATKDAAEKAKETVEKIKESDIAQGVKESLVGTEVDAQPSAQIRADFSKHAIRDEETGEEYMGQTEFVNAIAPPEEDYVSTNFSFMLLDIRLHIHTRTGRHWE